MTEKPSHWGKMQQTPKALSPLNELGNKVREKLPAHLRSHLAERVALARDAYSEFLQASTEGEIADNRLFAKYGRDPAVEKVLAENNKRRTKNGDFPGFDPPSNERGLHATRCGWT
jgi:hypothetical protein